MITTCPDCNGQVSDQAPACVHCGCPIASRVVEAVPSLTRTKLPANLKVGRQVVNWSGGAAVKGYSDATVNGAHGLGTGSALVCLHKKGLCILRGTGRLPLHHSQVIGVEYVNAPTLRTESKSVLGRAALGTLVAGPVGAIVGAVSGVGTKQKTHPGYLSITFWDAQGVGPHSVAIGTEEAAARPFVARWNSTWATGAKMAPAKRRRSALGSTMLLVVGGATLVTMAVPMLDVGGPQPESAPATISPEAQRREARVSSALSNARRSLLDGDIPAAREQLEQVEDAKGARKYGDVKDLARDIAAATEHDAAVNLLGWLSEEDFEAFQSGAPLRTVKDLQYDVLNEEADQLARTLIEPALARRQELAAMMSSAKEKATPTEDYSLGVEASVVDSNRVRIHVTTNIPGAVEVMAGLALEGQAPDDIFIGTNERVAIRNGSGEVVLDTSDLPSGRYEAEASFYPRWGLKDRAAKNSGADEELEARVMVTLTGSGESAEDVARRKEGQRWVMENVNIGSPWDPSEWERFGDSESVTITRYNPRIIKGHYYPAIDMTVFVNTLKGEVSVWRMGRATE